MADAAAVPCSHPGRDFYLELRHKVGMVPPAPGMLNGADQGRSLSPRAETDESSIGTILPRHDPARVKTDR